MNKKVAFFPTVGWYQFLNDIIEERESEHQYCHRLLLAKFKEAKNLSLARLGIICGLTSNNNCALATYSIDFLTASIYAKAVLQIGKLLLPSCFSFCHFYNDINGYSFILAIWMTFWAHFWAAF